jgi:hypothetical protein
MVWGSRGAVISRTESVLYREKKERGGLELRAGIVRIVAGGMKGAGKEKERKGRDTKMITAKNIKGKGIFWVRG